MNKFVSGGARTLIWLLAIAACFLRSWTTEAQNRRVTLDSLGTRINLFSPAISPDGKHIAVVTSRADYADNHFVRSLVLVDVVTGVPRTVALGQSNANAPQWSPAGDRLAWLGTADDDKPQVFVMLMDGNKVRPVRVSHMDKGVQSYEWSPDGKSIAFIAADPPVERTGYERYNRSFEVVDNDYLATEAPAPAHVWLVSSAGGEALRLTSGAESATDIGWLRSGQSIAWVSQPRPHDGDFMDASSKSTALRAIDIGGGAPYVIVPTPARILSSPKSAPNGEFIAFQRFHGPEPWTRPKDVAVVRLSGGPPRDVTTVIDRDIGEFVWQPDSKGVVVTAPDGTRQALWAQPLDGSSRRLDVGPVTDIVGLTVSNAGGLAFIGREPKGPPELYIMTSLNDKPRRLTRFNEHLAALDLGHSETIKWRLDGFEETGVLVYPPDFKHGQRVSLVLNIHGGPEESSKDAFDLDDQLLAAQGWAVFKPNYRGSDSQGSVFQSAIVKDLANGPGRDIMAGIAAVKARGFVDEDRIAVSGWSYGGYMTAWLIGHYQGWSSAVVGAPLTNFLDWYDLSCCNVWATPTLGGSPWLNDNATSYWRYSPVAYAAHVTTPTLILAHTGDPVAPVTQSYNFYHALKDNGVPVQFIVYPVQGHPIAADPVHERDTYRRWISWIDHHFGVSE